MMLKPVSVDRAETIYSVISRLAAINGSGNARALVRHLGISRMGFDRSEEAFKTLSTHSGIPMETFLKASYRPHSKHHLNIGGSIVAKTVISRVAPRFCSLCVVEDVNTRSGRPVVRPFQRFSWTIDDIAACHKHGVALDRASGPDQLRHEFVVGVSERMSMVEARAVRAERVEISRSDLYFAARLDGDASPVPDLDALPYHVSKSLCERLGVLDAHGPEAHVPKSSDELAVVRERGFNLIRISVGGLRDCLAELTKGYWKSRRAHGFQHVFGNLYRHLANHNDEDHKGLIELVKGVAVENLPLGPPDNFLGMLKGRRWHSVISFSREYRLTPHQAAAMLTREGFIPVQSGFECDSFSKIIFDAELTSPSFPRHELMNRLSLTRRMKLDRYRDTAIFGKEGTIALRPHPDDAGIYRLYSIVEAERLLARMTSKAGNATASDLCRPRDAARRSMCSIDEVLQLLADGELQQVDYQPNYLFEGIYVSPSEVRTKTKLPYQGWVHPYELAARFDISQDEAAGLLRRKIIYSDFVNYGFGTALVTTQEAVAEFDRRYISLATIAKRKGKRPAEIARKFENSGILPGVDSLGGRPLFYLRHELDL
jgi:hypothetical protein